MYKKSSLLSLLLANLSITLLLKSFMFIINSLSVDSIAKADSRSWDMVFLKNDFIRFRVLKHRSASDVVIGIVTRIFNNVSHSLNVALKFFSIMKSKIGKTPEIEFQFNIYRT